MAWTFEATERGYANLWRTATLKGGADATQAESFANKIIASEQRYRAVQAATGVPWYFIGALHMRESSCNFAGVLHNGEHIIGTGKLTSLVPEGRGPFATWEESAVDALKLKDMHRVQHWSAPRILFQTEGFNGLGYVARGINAPYVWAGTNHEQRGKYVADHQFDPNAEDTQLGVAAVLIRLAEKRPDIHADLYPATPTEKPPVDDQQPPKTGETIPPEKVTTYNAGIEDCIIELAKAQRPILERFLKAPSAMTDEEKRRLVIMALGGTPPPSSPVVLLPAPAATAPPSGTATPATNPAPASPTSVNISAAIAGVLASLGLSATGVIGAPVGPDATTTGMLLPLLSMGAGALGIPSPVVSMISTMFGKLFAPTPPKA